MNPPLPSPSVPRPSRGAHRVLSLLAAGALSWAAAAPAEAQSYSKLVVFGDSLSDTGNHADRSASDYGLRFPTYFFNYTNNRYTSGRDTRPASATFKGVWVEQLAKAFLGLPKPKPSEEGGLDFAYGSGRTSDGTHPDFIPQISPLVGSTYALTIDDMGLQVTNFLSAGAADASALYCLWGGNNDLTSVNPTAAGVQQAITNEIGLIQRLALAGARNFLVVNVPPLGSTPTVIATVGAERAAGVNQLAGGFRAALQPAINQLAAGLARAGISIDVRVVDSFGLLVDVLQDPGAYGFATVTGIGQQSPDPARDDADRYLFWDGFHPTAHAHYQVAAEAFAMVSGQSVVQVGAETTTINRAAETGAFVLTRTGENLAAPLTVGFSLRGNARSGTDFADVGSSVTFAPGARRAAIPVTPSRAGGKRRSAVLTVGEGSGYRSGELREATIELVN